MANVGKTRSPAISSVHDPPDPDLIYEINTTQEHRGTTAKAQQTPSALHRGKHHHGHSQTLANTAIPPNSDHSQTLPA